MEKLNELASEIVENLVACDSAEPEAVEQYHAWTLKRLAEALRALEQRAEAAEAQLAELEKQEPVGNFYEDGPGNWWQIGPHDKVPHVTPLFTRAAPAADLAELVPVITRLKRRYVCNEGRESEFIACVTPERSSIGAGQVWDDWRELSAILRNIKQKHGSAN